MTAEFGDFDVIIDNDNEVKTFEKVEIQTMFNKANYSAAYGAFTIDGNLNHFAHKILSNTIIQPEEFKKAKFFTHDPEALNEILVAIMDLHEEESKKREKKKKNSSLKAYKKD